jgi:VCBS repeat protein/FG-GAP repeat protein
MLQALSHPSRLALRALSSVSSLGRTQARDRSQQNRARLLSVPLVLIFAGDALAQSVIYEIDGAADGDEYGHSVSGAGDVNADGFDDFIVGSPLDDYAGPDTGRAVIYSGVDGSVIHTFNGVSFFDQLGYSVGAAGDVNADGHDDVIVGAPLHDGNGTDAGAAFIYSDFDGSVLEIHYGATDAGRLGHSVSGAGDVNSDGTPDVIVGAPLHSVGGDPRGRAVVFSGADGSTLWEWVGANNDDETGFAVRGVGDLSGDGFHDVIVGEPGYQSDDGRARVFSGQSGTSLFGLSTVGGRSGASVGGGGDVDGDGTPDVVVGSPAWINERGYVRVFSGQGGGVLRSLNTPEDALDRWGHAVDMVGDLNGDGHSDLAVGIQFGDAGSLNCGSVYVYSGKDWSLFYRLDGLASGDQFGSVVSVAGDVDGDGFTDLISGAPFSSAGLDTTGSVRVTSGLGGGGPISPYCLGDGTQAACPCVNYGSAGSGCQNSTTDGARLTWTGTHFVTNDDLVFHVSNVRPNQTSVLIQGSTAISMTFRDGLLCTGNPTHRVEYMTFDSQGTTSSSSSIVTEGNVHSGDTRYYQVWYRDPNLLSPCGALSNFTNGVKVIWRF